MSRNAAKSVFVAIGPWPDDLCGIIGECQERFRGSYRAAHFAAAGEIDVLKALRLFMVSPVAITLASAKYIQVIPVGMGVRDIRQPGRSPTDVENERTVSAVPPPR